MAGSGRLFLMGSAMAAEDRREETIGWMERVKNEEPQMCCGRSRGYGVLWKSVWKAGSLVLSDRSAGNVEEGGKV